MKAGDILVSTWGYDQTNVDFYRVEHIYAKSSFVRVVKLKRNEVHDGPNLTYEATASNQIEDRRGLAFNGRRKVKNAGYDFIEIEDFALARLWNGKPVSGSQWA